MPASSVRTAITGRDRHMSDADLKTEILLGWIQELSKSEWSVDSDDKVVEASIMYEGPEETITITIRTESK